MIGDRRRVFRQRLLLSFLAVLALASARQLLVSPSHGQDFRDFFAAATLVAHGGNPYDGNALALEQDRLYNQPAHSQPGDPAYYNALPYPQGPWVALAVVPLTALHWQAAYAIYLAAALAAIAASTWALMRLLGFNGRLLPATTAAVLASPIAFINIFQGQPVPFLLAALAGAWALQRQGRHLLAGALLATGWIKPHIGLPLLLVVALLEARAVRSLLSGFALGSLTLFGVAALVMRGAFLEWPRAVLGQWSGVLQQADLSSINAFYYPALSGIARQLAVVMILIASGCYATWVFRHGRERLARALTLLLLTFVAAPYAHSYDTLLLLPVVLALLGPLLSGWRHPSVEIAIWAFATVPLFYFAGFHLGYYNGFTAIPVALLAFAWHRRRAEAGLAERMPVAA